MNTCKKKENIIIIVIIKYLINIKCSIGENYY